MGTVVTKPFDIVAKTDGEANWTPLTNFGLADYKQPGIPPNGMVGDFASLRIRTSKNGWLWIWDNILWFPPRPIRWSFGIPYGRRT